MNQITLIGYLGQDVEVKESNGTAYAHLNLATRHTFNDRDGERQERTDWHRVVAFGKLAQTCDRLGKGDLVGVAGRLQYNTYKRKEDGVEMTRAEIVAAQVDFLHLKKRDRQ